MKSATKTSVAWFTSEMAAEHLGFPSVSAFRRFLERLPESQRPKIHWLGSRMRFRQVDLDGLVESISPSAEQVTPLRVVRGGKR